MNISLTNFRCWDNKTISLPSKGICLINGKSGRGKSSILNSIVFCITGKGKNITTFLKKHTKVSIKIDNITITRSRGPNRLLVQKTNESGEIKTYEDDVAQSLINSTFGSEFCSTSYIDQDNLNSFIFLSPTEKIEFLERLLLAQYNIDDKKTIIKDHISKVKTDYTSHDSKVSTLKDILSKMEYKTQNKLIIEKILIKEENCTKCLQKLKANLDVSEKNLKLTIGKLKKYEDEQRTYIDHTSSIKMMQHSRDTLSSQMDELSKFLKDKDIYTLEKQKEMYNKNKEYVKLKISLTQTSEKYNIESSKNKIALKELEDLFSTLSSPDKKLKDELKKSRQLLSEIFQLDDKLKDQTDHSDEMDVIKKYISDKNEDIAMKQKTINELEKCYECPSCNKILKINNNSLVLFSSDSSVSLKILKDEVNSLKKSVIDSDSKLSILYKEQLLYEKNNKEYNDLFDKLESIGKKYNIDQIQDDVWLKNKIDQYELNDLKYEDVSRKIRDISNDRFILEMQKEIKRLEILINAFGNIKDVNDLEMEEHDYLLLIEEIAFLKEKMSSLKKVTQQYDQIVDKLKEMSSDKYPDKNYKEMIDSETVKRDLYETKISTYRQYIVDLESWVTIYQQNLKYKEIEDLIRSSEKKKEDLNDRMRCLVKLKEHVKNAERKSISNFIDSLNEHASMYIEQFFPDEDIRVFLKTTQEHKTEKREKISLNFEVNYRDMTGDLSFLSGGEKDRVNLAFTLAFSELVDNRMLLLDECISSLDVETTNVVLEHLKEKYKGNLILLVSHQANLGFFDQVIEL
jgi:DNA repair exonuclease SbcCD ATPase subunit